MSETPGHGDEQHHDFDPEPAQALSPDEPRTPSWMPVFGACVVLVGTVFFLVRFSDGEPRASSSAALASSAAGTAARKPAPAASQPRTPAQDASGRKQLIENMRKERAKASASPSSGAPSASASAGPTGSAAVPPPAKPKPRATAAPTAAPRPAGNP